MTGSQSTKYVVVSEHPETFDSYVILRKDNPFGWTWTRHLEEAQRFTKETALVWAKYLRTKLHGRGRIKKV